MVYNAKEGYVARCAKAETARGEINRFLSLTPPKARPRRPREERGARPTAAILSVALEPLNAPHGPKDRLTITCPPLSEMRGRVRGGSGSDSIFPKSLLIILSCNHTIMQPCNVPWSLGPLLLASNNEFVPSVVTCLFALLLS